MNKYMMCILLYIVNFSLC